MIKVSDDGSAVVSGTPFIMTVQAQSVIRIITENFTNQFGEENAFYWKACIFKLSELNEDQIKETMEFWVQEDEDGELTVREFKELYDFITSEFDS